MSVRVGIDVSPLAQTRAGTARYLSGLLGGLERHPDLELTRLAYTRRGRAAAVVRDTAWYLALLPREARRRGLDVLHCTTFRAPVRSRVPLVVTVHDLALLRHPGLFSPGRACTGGCCCRDVIRRRGRVIAVSAFTGREVVELTRRARRSGFAWCRTRPTPASRPTARRPAATTCFAVVDPRAAQEPAAPGRGDAAARGSSCASSAPAAGAVSRSAGTACAGSASSPTRSWPSSTAARSASPTRRSTRASASPCWRRCAAARPS